MNREIAETLLESIAKLQDLRFMELVHRINAEPSEYTPRLQMAAFLLGNVRL